MKSTGKDMAHNAGQAHEGAHGAKMRDRRAAEDRRLQILKEALSCMMQSADGDVSLAAVASRLGISRNLVYYYFPNQTSLISAMIDQEFAELAENMRQAQQSQGQVRVASLVALYVEFVMCRPDVERVLLLSHKTGSLFRHKIEEKQKVMVDWLLEAYAKERGGPCLLKLDLMRHAADAAIEFLRLFVVLEAGQKKCTQQQIVRYCTDVVMCSLDEAAKMALTKTNKNAGLGAKPQQPGVCDFAGNETKQVNRA